MTTLLARRHVPIARVSRWIIAIAGVCLGTTVGKPSALAVDLILVPSMSHDCQVQSDQGVLTIETIGDDPYLVWRLPSPTPGDQRVLSFEYFSTTGAQSVHGYLGPPISEQSRFEMPDLSIAQGWQDYSIDLVEGDSERLPASVRLVRVDFGTQPGYQLKIRRLQLRERTESERERAKQRQSIRAARLRLDREIQDYLSKPWTASIQEVIVDDESVTIRGRLGRAEDETQDFRLREILPHESVRPAGDAAAFPITIESGQFNAMVPRFDGVVDRNFSAWRVQGSDDGTVWTDVSPRSYPTRRSFRAYDKVPPHPKPESQKGLGGVDPNAPLRELEELGVDAITINLVLNRFIAETPGRDREPIEAEGAGVYFDTSPFEYYDRLIDFARLHRMVVSAIVLIPQSKQANQRSPLIHPESEGGIYAMPDLTTRRGAQIYSDVMRRIADRYADTSRSPGGITNWIAHNEVDFHSVWTNMGPQPRRVFLEAYYRSMRIMDAAARHRNPHARVFASFTHHWNVPDDEKWRNLSPRDAILGLQRLSRLEGEFPWGIAYHPYPQSLFAKYAWEDDRATQSPDTPLITMQNIDQLGEFLSRSEMRTDGGQMRPVLLSEQGYHTPSYSAEDQRAQAGSLWYAMKRIRGKEWIESFHYHRWIDHPHEGGLKLGLKTLPDAANPSGKQKLSWRVYQAIGTPREASIARGLPQPTVD